MKKERKLFRGFVRAVGRVWRWGARHKVVAVFLILAVGAGSYVARAVFFRRAPEVRYITATAAQETIIVSVAGTGQMSASSQVEVKPKVSGDVVSISVADGQAVAAGTVLARLDARDSEKAVRDAEANLETVRLALEKLTQPADQLSVIQAENALIAAEQAKQDAKNDLEKAYEDGFTAVANAFLDLPGVMTGLDSVLNGTTLTAGVQPNAYAYYDMMKSSQPAAEQFLESAISGYASARRVHDAAIGKYKNASRYSDRATIEALVGETYEATKTIAEAVKSAKNLLDLVNDTLSNRSQARATPALLSAHLASLQTYTGTANGHLSTLLGDKNSLRDLRDAITAADRTIAERTEALAKLKSGADSLDVRSQELSVRQRENALQDAREKLGDYTIRAPFDGVVAKVNVRRGDSVSSGTALATFITKQQIAEISLNEVDVAKVRAKQKATVTFDAIPDLSVSGFVASVDTVGTVSQGVVTYVVKIGLDAQDLRIKPGMSVSASIVTDTKPNALVVPSGAVKTQGDFTYVEVFDDMPRPKRVMVETGLSNDTTTEIVTGLEAGDRVVVRTISNGTMQTQPRTNVPGLFGAPSGGGRSSSGGSGIRIVR